MRSSGAISKSNEHQGSVSIRNCRHIETLRHIVELINDDVAGASPSYVRMELIVYCPRSGRQNEFDEYQTSVFI